MIAVGMLFLTIAAVDVLLITALLVRELAKDGVLAPMDKFVSEIFRLQVRLLPQVLKNGVAVSIYSLAYAIITVQPMVILTSAFMWVASLSLLYILVKKEV